MSSVQRIDVEPYQRIAVFPGSFKPAHRGHIRAIEYLCARSDVDVVRVIVSNRSRPLPGSNLALGGQSCVDNLRFLLSRLKLSKPVHVSLARHRAIDAATDLIDRAAPGASLLFCVGQEDAERGDDRFTSRIDLSRRNRVAIKLISIPADEQPVHATDLRRILAARESGQQVADLLPEALTDKDKADYWHRVCIAVEPVAVLSKRKIEALLKATPYANYRSLECLCTCGMDPVFRLISAKGNRFQVYYSGDCVTAGSFDDPTQPLPPRRLAVGARVTRHLLKCCEGSLWRPTRIAHWDKPHRLLVLNEPQDNCSVADLALEHSAADLESIALATGQCLAQIHRCSSITEPLWGSGSDEIGHWHQCIAARRSKTHPRRLHRLLKPRHCLVHLDFQPQNLRWNGRALELTTLERTSSFGDPAWDIATFVAAMPPTSASTRFIDRFFAAYEQTRSLMKDKHHDADRCLRAVQIAEHLNTRSEFPGD